MTLSTDIPIIALVPLRAGSKGLSNKNIRMLGDKPLYQHALDQAHAAGISDCVISTDIPSLLDMDTPPPNARIAKRPAALASDTTSMDTVLQHVLHVDVTSPAHIVLLQATSPLRNAHDIQRAIALYKDGDFDLVLSATSTDSGILKYGTSQNGTFTPVSDPTYCFSNRAQLPQVFRPNGAVYVFSADWIRQTGTLAGGRIGMIEMPSERSLDIDNIDDFKTAASYLQRGSVHTS